MHKYFQLEKTEKIKRIKLEWETVQQRTKECNGTLFFNPVEAKVIILICVGDFLLFGFTGLAVEYHV
ncbi:hypothetical protein BR63_10060 [Thermanaerosceptrum fracticalcis]|uniref:Uncharacterized protein n=1 Tax=Thermanaerosceptrum fracticalcis TaxID=1712410 RepID=A0A7G6E3G5_THEFR|nr:hypothetical protein [Thermanaerosceptrum fracticalcis]QNB46619.1 hypothetical protein BR63_10060 [Thermanaerosceptrum fracticalcis]